MSPLRATVLFSVQVQVRPLLSIAAQKKKKKHDLQIILITYHHTLSLTKGGDEKTALLSAVASEVAKHGHYCARYRAKAPVLGKYT